MINYVLSAALFVFLSSVIIFAQTNPRDLFNLIFWFIVGTMGGMYAIEIIRALIK